MRAEIILSGRYAKTYGDFARTVIEKAGGFFPKRGRVMLSVSLVDDASMRVLNRRYRGKDATTNVLSFSANISSSGKNAQDLGDIVISIPQTRKEAEENGWTAAYALARLLVHGFLHLLDYDHIRERDARKMEAQEGKILMSISLKGKNKSV